MGQVKLCECGCGKPAPLAKYNYPKRGVKKGEPMRFVHGHNRRLQTPEYEVDKVTGCWVWQHGISDGRYGMKNNVLAHRRYYETYKGPIPKGLEIDHVCRNTFCVNPDHLEAVTHAENLRRRVAYERATYGRALGGRKKKAA